MREGGGNCLKYLKKGWKRKEGRGSKYFKKGGGNLCQRGAGTPLQTMLVTLAVNIWLECIESNTFFKLGEQINVIFISNSLQRKMID